VLPMSLCFVLFCLFIFLTLILCIQPPDLFMLPICCFVSSDLLLPSCFKVIDICHMTGMVEYGRISPGFFLSRIFSQRKGHVSGNFILKGAEMGESSANRITASLPPFSTRQGSNLTV
jgi:hypothetical protein